MNLNDLIKEKGEDFVHTRKLEIPGEVASLEGIERFDCLEELKIKRENNLTRIVGLDKECEDSPKIRDYSLLVTLNLTKTLRVLDLKTNTSLADISFLSEFQALESIDLFECLSILDFSPLDSDSLKRTIKYLCLGPSNDQFDNDNTIDISFLADYQVLEELVLSDFTIQDFSVLQSESLQRTLKSIYIVNENDFPDFSQFEKLEKVYISDNGGKDFSCFNSPSLQRRMKELNFFGMHNLRDVSFLRGYQRLEYLRIALCHVINFSPLDSKTLKQTIKDLNLDMTDVRDVSFLRGYQALESLSLLSCHKLKDFSSLESDSLKRTLKKLGLGNSEHFADLSLLRDYECLEVLDINRTSVSTMSDLLAYEFVKNGSLKKIILPESINWLQVRDGKYINQEVIKELRKRGVEIEAKIRFIPPETPPNLQDYLHSQLGLEEEYVDAIISEFPLNNIQLFVQDLQVSANKVFHVRTKDGRKLLIKLETNPTKAKVEQAANYYLSRDINFAEFIVPSDIPKPVEFGGVYLLLQEDISDNPNAIQQRPLKYYLRQMAILHAKGRQALERSEIELLEVRMRTFYELLDCLERTEYKRLASISKLKSIKNQYEDSKAVLIHRSNRSLILKDPRQDNRKGKYIIDLENLCIGDSSIDLFMTLYDTALDLSEHEREKYCDFYYQCYCKEKGIGYTPKDSQLFFEKVRRHAMMIVGGSELNALLKPEQLRDPLKRKRAILCADMMGIRV